MKLKPMSLIAVACLLLAGLFACSSDEGGGEDTLADAGEPDAVDTTGEDTSEDVEEDVLYDDGGGGDADANATPGDIVVSNIRVSHSGGSEWSMHVGLGNAGGSNIRVDHCTYEAETVADGTHVADGVILENGATLFPPSDIPDEFPPFTIEFEPSQGADPVEAEMTVHCVAADDEDEQNTANNMASATFDW
jgi:hypothetical protein